MEINEALGIMRSADGKWV